MSTSKHKYVANCRIEYRENAADEKAVIKAGEEFELTKKQAEVFGNSVSLVIDDQDDSAEAEAAE